jgi:hypothetical protein
MLTEMLLVQRQAMTKASFAQLRRQTKDVEPAAAPADMQGEE